MANIRFYYDNLWDAMNPANLIVSTEKPYWPGTHTLHRWPTRSWRSNYDVNGLSLGRFVITAANQNVYFDEGGGALTATIPVGTYTAETLMDELETQMNGVGAINYTWTHPGNIFTATGDSSTFELLCNTGGANAIWATIGFNTAADTGFAIFHAADYIRIHTSESLRIDMGADISVYAVFVILTNLTAGGTINIQASDDNWLTLEIDQQLDRSTVDDNKFCIIFTGAAIYRYWGITVTDIANPDGYIEVGRVWMGDYLEPRIGFSGKRGRDPQDPSLVKESEGGQVSTIQRTRYGEWDYEFQLIENKPDYDDMYASRGESRELVVLEKPHNITTLEYEYPENNFYYVRFKSFKFDKLAGDIWELKAKVIEER
jgi:hypothetical protein